MKTLSQTDVIDYAHQENVEGNGSKEKPLIFKEFDFRDEYSESVELVNSQLHIRFVGISFHQQEGQMTLKRCKNISFEKCSFHNLTLKKCCNATAVNCEIFLLKLRRCDSSIFNQCAAEHLVIDLSFGNNFKDCHIKSTLNCNSKGNIFEKGRVGIDDYEEFIKGGSLKGQLIVIPGMLIVIFMALSFYNLDRFMSIFGTTLLIITLVCIVIMIFRDRLKARRFPPNLII
jgi:hypothetical protein